MSDIVKQTANLDATALAELVGQGEVTALELVEAAIARLESVNGSLNAVVTPMFEQALDLARSRPGSGGQAAPEPFPGVPFLIKDFLAEVKGVRFTEGSAFLADHIPDEDSELVKRFARAGLICLGKTNTPEFAIGATTEPAFFGPTHNPWDLSRTPGGSSGGAAAAVAARVVPMAHGNDAGGSIRIPASCCGLVGLKPSRGRVSLAPHYGDLFGGIVAELGLTRSVRDCAALLDAVAGPVTGDPYFAGPGPEGSFTADSRRAPGRLRIGFSIETPLGDPTHPECGRAVRNTAALCESLGHQVTEAAPTYNALKLWENLTRMLASGVAWAIDDWARRTGQTPSPQYFEPFVWAFAERGRQISAAQYLLAVQDVQQEVRALSAFFEQHDLWLTPTLGEPPVPLGTLVFRDDPIELRRRTAAFSPFTYLCNATGQPGISLPMHWTGDGLPVGVHFAARLGDEASLLRLARQLEEAQPWEGRLPPVVAGQ